MNELKVFNSPEFGQVRTFDKGGEPWFVGKDVATILGYERTADAIRAHVDDDDKGVGEIQTPGGKQKIVIINESGLYSLVLSSKLPTAKKFKRWITSEVLPAIRKHGAYMTPEKIEEALLNPDTLIKLATELKAEREARKNAELEAASAKQVIGELKPKADYTDRILSSKGTVTTTAIAKDYGMSATGFNKLLHELHVIYKIGKQWFLYAKYQAKGYTHSKTFDFIHSDGKPDCNMQTEWTQKGRLFLYEFLKGHGVLPMIERNQEAGH
ncbi:phage antirepressor KilAC domain-containing protein [Megasphaera sp.]|uniref:phage antirepressor KilAC domain-containing protein n=1 Tax=Megasphaera sp. TaxID=2023260 RepID=UPI004029447B